ncbi:TetR/AcrR family transcriptional regulator [Cronobacter dublinensis]|uniref:TetR/AcrR family transcriptional regulator n=1 Tax=Cronobacter dublinensis TaxID=413497 RepID=UPI00300E1E7E
MSLENISKKTKGELTRERLLACAAHEFAKQGFHAAKISDIVKLSGVTQPVFYSYFKTKDQAYESLINEFHERLEELVVSMMIEASLPKENVLEDVTQSLKTFLKFFYENYDLTMISLFQSPHDAENRDNLKKWIARNMVIEQMRGFYTDIIPINSMASCYLGVLIQTFLERPDEADLDNICKERATFICKGLTTL